jgi:hypothetical protein
LIDVVDMDRGDDVRKAETPCLGKPVSTRGTTWHTPPGNRVKPLT